jgi:formylglycine-generating enzyme required for sulfatase activity
MLYLGLVRDKESRMRFFLAFFVLLLLLAPLSAQEATPEATELAAGDSRVDEFGIEQVWVPAGCFVMGTSEEQATYAESLEAPSWAADRISSEQPAHEVCLTAGYWIDKYEVTNAAFAAFVEAGGYETPELWSAEGQRWLDRRSAGSLPVACDSDDLPDHPRACITWFEAEAYAAWRGGALPSEAQWEFAARGEDSLIYPWGNEWDASLANVLDSSESMPVGSFPDGASWVGAEDMSGNLMEWVNDWLSTDYYGESPVEDPLGPEQGRNKVEKGGWFGSNPLVARAAYRHFEDPPAYQDHHIGVRLVTAAE